ncbi:sulfatase-like hydrolase/transferase [Verrucomicrobiota bacterium]
MIGGQRPNIVVLVSHNTGRHISPYGISAVDTPNAERLAGEGVLFENSFCTSPVGCSSRAGLFSGRYPHSFGVLGRTDAWAGFRFSPEAAHAAKHFKDMGYATMLLGGAQEIAGAGCPDLYYDGMGFDARGPEGQRLFARDLETELPAILDARKDPQQPFYLQIGPQETHASCLKDGVVPYTEKGVTIPESAALRSAVNSLDEGLGHILNILQLRFFCASITASIGQVCSFVTR